MIVSYSHRFGLFCSDRSVARSFLHVTPFCALSGKVWSAYIIVDSCEIGNSGRRTLGVVIEF